MSRRFFKKRTIKDRINKTIAMEREHRKIRVAQNNLGCIILSKPLRDGWHRTYRLRDDILRHKNVRLYLEIFNVIVCKIWGREKKYADKAWRKYYDEKYIYYQRPGIRYLNDKEFLKLSAAAKKYFILLKIRLNYSYHNIYVCTLPKGYFVTTYYRAYIISRNIISPELERRKQELNEILSSSKYYKYNSYLKSSYKRCSNDYKKSRRKSKVELAKKIIFELN